MALLRPRYLNVPYLDRLPWQKMVWVGSVPVLSELKWQF